MTLAVQHIDTCLPCYLQDHHTREGEALIGIAVDGKITTLAVKDYLITEATLCEAIPEHYTEDDILSAINAEFSGAAIAEDELWDEDLEVDEDDDEPVQAWFLFTWPLVS